ncbi:hypothetical protein BsWGS_06058 [Bradybaena similaris]
MLLLNTLVTEFISEKTFGSEVSSPGSRRILNTAICVNRVKLEWIKLLEEACNEITRKFSTPPLPIHIHTHTHTQAPDHGEENLLVQKEHMNLADFFTPTITKSHTTQI